MSQLWISLGLDYPDYPDGYFPFEQNPVKNPPRVRKPPYRQSNSVCEGLLESKEVVAQSLHNLCGNLNEGLLPLNPMHQNIHEQSYPFELIKNRTLDFFSRTLPVLKEDDTLPKVARFMDPSNVVWYKQNRKNHNRIRRSAEFLKNQNFVYINNNLLNSNISDYDRPDIVKITFPLTNNNRNVSRYYIDDDITTSGSNGSESKTIGVRDSSGRSSRRSRKLRHESYDLQEVAEEGRGISSFCDNNYGILCMIYNSFMSKKEGRASVERHNMFPLHGGGGRLSLDDHGLRPLTPCPSSVEYVTPVYARNYQGVWRYVVQIPYEGYFTQTIEITRCLSSKCHYLSGSCLSSPRWVSLLVAEIYYPDALFPKAYQFPDFQRADEPSTRGQFSQRQGTVENLQHCDGVDNIGCFQVRLYYDWFLVAGSCKCWKQDFYAKFAF